jgi:glycosyltransferase involved in cell wall biosynthesis
MKGPASRIFVDCTHTFRTGGGTGIQRVVRHYADELLAIGREDGIDVVPVRVAGRVLMPLPIAQGRVAFPRASSAREAANAPTVPASSLARATHTLVATAQQATGSQRLAAWLGAGPNESGYSRWAAMLAPTTRPLDAIAPARGDTLLSLDSSWVYDIRSVLDAAGGAGATRVAVLCDVLPLTQPQWFTDGTRRWFRGWLDALLPRLDGVVTISEATRAELAALVAAGRIAAPMPPSAAVHLGAEVGEARDGPVRSALATRLAEVMPPAFLTVGTLEPRKNVDFALDLFEALDARGVALQWHIVGAPGWLAEHTAERIRRHPAYGERLHWWTDLSDAELAWLYRHAAALVAVSKAEGFGLPLVEARLHGLPVFASDIAVFREVLGEEARYLPLSDAGLAAAILEDFLVRPRPAPVPSKVARSWRESARELLETVIAMKEGKLDPAPVLQQQRPG